MNTTETNPFKEGDCAMLNSGSPILAVESIETDENDRPCANVSWSVQSGEIHSAQFPLSCLRRVKQEYVNRRLPDILD